MITLWRRIGPARAILLIFFLGLCALGAQRGIGLARLGSDTVSRFGMNLVLVLALVPALQAGAGLNFGLPIGILCGLLGVVLGIEAGFQGIAGISVAAGIGATIALPVGWLYARLLRAVEGQEMVVGTYLAFSAVSVMCMVWLLMPVHHPEMVWALGKSGLRTTISYREHGGKTLDRLGEIELGGTAAAPEGDLPAGDTRGLVIPTGLLVVSFGLCLGYAAFSKTRAGVMLRMAGANPVFARLNGVSVESCRTQGVVLSTVLGAVGIVLYAESFGFVQLYQAPLMMAFPAVAAVLIGGASLSRAGVRHAIVGAFLFQGLLTVALPVANEIVQQDFSAVAKVAFRNVSEIVRVLVTSGMILYALTRKEAA